MNSLVHLIYSSKATPSFAEHQIPALLETARRSNAARGVTGMLLYIDGNFFQILEGEAAKVADVFERIRQDPRHSRVTQIIREPILERAFGEWTMGFSTVELREVKEHVGENDFFTSATCLEQMTAGRAKKLLNAFRNGRWRADTTGMHQAHRIGA